MKANRWYGKHDVRVEEVPDPEIVDDHDAIVRVTLTAICGSDLHLHDGYIPSMKEGDILGHEFMGEVVEVGKGVKTGQTHVQRYMRPLLENVQNGEIDPSFVITHRMSLSQAPGGYETFKKKEDECIKVVMRP